MSTHVPFVLAVEPDHRQASVLKRVIRERVHAELLVVDSRDAAIAATSARVPDVILLTALLSPRDEQELIGHLRGLSGAEHVQAHTIPQLASSSQDSETAQERGLFGKLRRKKNVETIPGCDPTSFADEVGTFIARAAEMKAHAALVPPTIVEPPRRDGARPQEHVPSSHHAASTAHAAPPHAAAAPHSADAGDDEPAVGESAWSSPFEWRKPDPAAQKKRDAPPRTPLVTKAPLAVIAEEEEARRAEADLRAREEGERERVEAEAAATREHERREAEAAAQRERELIEAEAAAATRERERVEAEQRAKEEADGRANEEATKRERERLAAEQRAREEAERRAKEEAIKRERLAAEQRAKEEAERRAKEEAAKRERERLAAELRAKEEAERRAKEEAAKRERERLEAERRAKEEAEAAAAAEAERERVRLVAEAVEQERLQMEAEESARREAEEQPEIEIDLDHDPFSDFRMDDEHESALLKLIPVTAWARTGDGKPQQTAQRTAEDELHGLMAGLSIPPHVAGVAYARGCRIRRVRVPAPRPATRSRLSRPVILSKRALQEARNDQQSGA